MKIFLIIVFFKIFLLVLMLLMMNINNKIINNNNKIIIVFDLDYTIWPIYADRYVPPFYKNKTNNKIYDFKNKEVKFFNDVFEILDKLKKKNYIISSVSKTGAPETARQLINISNLKNYFKHSIYNFKNKVLNMKNISLSENINDLHHCILFDDEDGNIIDCNNADVLSMKVDPKYGITKELVNEGLKKIHKKLNIPYKDIFN